MDGYLFEAELSDDDKNRIIYGFYGPGERVRIANEATAPDEIRALVKENQPLVIKYVRVTADRHIEYGFQGRPGSFAGGHFVDARDCRHLFGAVVREGDKTYAVELEGDFGAFVGGSVFELSGDPEKFVAYNQGFKSEQDMVDYLETEGPFIGELNVAPRKDGSWSLVSIPWSADATSQDIEAARTAVLAAPNETVAAP